MLAEVGGIRSPARTAAAPTVHGGAWPWVAEPGPQWGAQVGRLCFWNIPHGQDDRVGKQQRAGKLSLRVQLPPRRPCCPPRMVQGAGWGLRVWQ